MHPDLNQYIIRIFISAIIIWLYDYSLKKTPPEMYEELIDEKKDYISLFSFHKISIRPLESFTRSILSQKELSMLSLVLCIANNSSAKAKYLSTRRWAVYILRAIVLLNMYLMISFVLMLLPDLPINISGPGLTSDQVMLSITLFLAFTYIIYTVFIFSWIKHNKNMNQNTKVKLAINATTLPIIILITAEIRVLYVFLKFLFSKKNYNKT